jgi:hypothetical protein
MRENDLRKILLVKAVEEADTDGTLVPPADRATAAREAMRNASPEGALADEPDTARLSRRSEVLLIARSQAIYERVVARFPFVDQVLGMLGSSTGITVILVVIGLAIGAGMSILDGSRRIDLRAFPLMAIVAWNLIAYIVLLLLALRGERTRPTPWRSGLASLGSAFATRLIARSRSFNAPLAAALRTFAREWLDAAKPLLLARAARAFHLAAAAVGAGLIAGLYVRGIAFDYQAGWESTFLDAERTRTMLLWLYTPASWLTGIPVPDSAQLETARWRGTGGGEPAARWIHLMAATTLIYVVIPRALLAIAAAVNAMRLALRAPVPASLPPYFRTAFAAVEGAVPRATAIVMPYACELPPQALARLIAWVPSVAGGPVAVEARDSIPYGEEEQFLETFGARGGDAADIVVLPFSLVATPEDENHGMVLTGARDRLAASRPKARLMVVIDEAPYVERMGGSPERVTERREVWRRFVEAHGLKAEFTSLAP